MADDTTTFPPIQVSNDALYAMSDENIDTMGRMFANMVRREQARLICARDGHLIDEQWGFYCTRCTETTHPEKAPQK